MLIKTSVVIYNEIKYLLINHVIILTTFLYHLVA